MNLLDKVREMQEVGDFVATTAEMDLLLAVLGSFQTGDAEKLEDLVKAVEIGKEFWPDDGEFETDRELLTRYRDMARLMEDDHAT